MDGVVIWGEVLFCIDFSMDFCALYFCGRLMGWHMRIRRLCAAAAICAAVGVFCTAVSPGPLTAVLLAAGWLLASVLLIPRTERRVGVVISSFFLFFFLEACTGGIMTTVFYLLNRLFADIGVSVSDGGARYRLFFLAAAVIFFVFGIVSRILTDADVKKLVQRSGIASVRCNGREAAIPCLFDSGNLAREPISGKPVMIVPYKEQITLGLDPEKLMRGILHGSRLIPIKTLDAESLCWGILPERVSLCADGLDIPDADVYIVFSAGVDRAIVPGTVLQHK